MESINLLFDQIIFLYDEFKRGKEVINEELLSNIEKKEEIAKRLMEEDTDANEDFLLDMIVDKNLKMQELAVIYNKLNSYTEAFLMLNSGLELPEDLIELIDENINYRLTRKFTIKKRFEENEEGFLQGERDRVRELGNLPAVHESYKKQVVKDGQSN